MNMVRIPVEPAITEYLHRKASKARIPLSGTFELTPVCNMNCKMCYVRMSREQQESIRPLRTAKEWLSLGEIAKQKGMLYLLLTGGEPFLHPQFREIMSGLHAMGFFISINSNATLIDEKTIAWLKKCPPVRINITLYGASNETYERLCGNPQGFTQVTKAIELLIEAGISVKLNCSLTPYNVDDLEGIMTFAKEHKLIVQATSYMFPPLRRDSSMIGKNDRFTPEEAAYQAARIECYLNGEEEYLERMKTNPPTGLPPETGEDCPVIEEGEGIRCRAGKCSFWVTWEGKLLPCGMLPSENSPDVFKVGFADAWKIATVVSRDIRLPAKCRTCELREQCKACAAMVLTESGNFGTVPKYRCKMSHSYADACKKLEQEINMKRGC